MDQLFSTDVSVLASLRKDDLVAEAKLRFLPSSGLKQDLALVLATDNAARTANGTLQLLRDRPPPPAASVLNDMPPALPSSVPAPQSWDDIVRLVQALHVSPQPATVQVFSSHEAVRAIPKFSGNPRESVADWIKTVNRVQSSARWTPELTVLNASTRLVDQAHHWHKVQGQCFPGWPEWSAALSSRFSYQMSPSEFIAYHSVRKLLPTETLATYIFEKNSMLQKAPFALSPHDRVMMILEDINNPACAFALATPPCANVDELLDRAHLVDKLRKLTSLPATSQPSKADPVRDSDSKKDHKPPHRTHSETTSVTPRRDSNPKYNPHKDNPLDMVCYRCGGKGHVSYDCTVKPAPPGKKPLRIDPSSQYTPSASFTPPVSSSASASAKSSPKTVVLSAPPKPSVSCVAPPAPHSLCLVPVTIDDSTVVDALPDSGSHITLMRSSLVPPHVTVHPWRGSDFNVAGGTVTPSGWFTATLRVGKLRHVMPRIAIADPLPVAMLLGKDWQFEVQARIVHEPSGAVCIMTPTTMDEFQCVSSSDPVVGCVVRSQFRSAPVIADSVKTPCGDPANAPMDAPPDTPAVVPIAELPAVAPPSDAPLSDDLTPCQLRQLTALTDEFSDIFTTSASEIGLFPDLEMEIHLTSDTPIKCKPYRLTEPDRVFLRDQVLEWFAVGVCRPSTSPYAAPAFVVDQPFHESTPRRMVIAYDRTINPITVKDPFPIDNMDDMVHKMSGKRYMSLFDIRRAFNNIRIREEDIPKTAAITPDDHIEFIRVPFGLTNAPAMLARALSVAYGHLLPHGLAKYYDDLGAAHHDFVAHLAFLRLFFEATRRHGLKMSRKKCTFAATEIHLLGRVISAAGELPDPNRIAAISNHRTLTSVHAVRSFLGFANTMRKHIQSFASIAAPLNVLLRKLPHADSPPRSNQPVSLNTDQQAAFDALKIALTTPPLLAFFVQGAPTQVETDASYTGLGACLSQLQDGNRRIIEYASRSLKDAETRYHSNELEIAAVHWALTDKFRLYLVGHPFTLVTDNFTTAYVVSKSKINRKFARYAVDLSGFDFTVVHRPGKLNFIADHLSRYPAPVLTVITSPDSRLKIAQAADSFCRQIRTQLEVDPSTLHLRQIRDTYAFDNDILVHRTLDHGSPVTRIVVPFALRTSVFKLCHDDAGHFDFRKTLDRIRARYWWSSLRKDTRLYVRGCTTCQQVNRRTTPAYGMLGERPLPNNPFEVLSVDHLKLPLSTAGNLYLIVHQCHATRFVVAMPSPNTAADDVVNALNTIIYRFGLPTTYVSDNGTAFTSNKFSLHLAKFGIVHSPTPPYTPQSNGLVERANQTVIATLTKFGMEHPTDWDSLLPNALLALNTATNSSTHASPFYLLHGYTPRLPPDELHLGTLLDDTSRLDQLHTLAEIRQISVENVIASHAENKRRFDANRTDTVFAPNDVVWYDHPQHTDTKLTPRFKGPYRIVQRVGNVCYRIAPVTQPSKTQVVHVQSLRRRLTRPNFDDPGHALLSDDDSTFTPGQPDVLVPDVSTPTPDPPPVADTALPVTTRPARQRRPPPRLRDPNFVLDDLF